MIFTIYSTFYDFKIFYSKHIISTPCALLSAGRGDNENMVNLDFVQLLALNRFNLFIFLYFLNLLQLKQNKF